MRPQFVYLNPDQNAYKPTLKGEWEIKEIKCTEKVSYWIAEHPYATQDGFEELKNLISKYPVCKGNNDDSIIHPNPFQTIHVPMWIAGPVCERVKSFYIDNINPHIHQPNFMEWGNVYERGREHPIDAYRIPHIDSERGMICNLWFTDHAEGTSGTELYEYKGKMIKNMYDFMVDESHPMYNEWHSNDLTYRLDTWQNFSKEEAEHWGFEQVGFAPSKYGTATLYQANTCHRPYLDESVDFRWSHTFCFMHKDLPVGNLLNRF